MAEAQANLPFVGIPSFGKVPIVTDLEALDADVAVVGAPYDLSTQARSGARFGPRGIRLASTIYGLRTVSYYDSELDEVMLEGVSMVDCGDVDMVHARPDLCLRNIEATLRTIVARGALPVVLGGDHAITIPVVRAFDDAALPDLCVVQIDAHLDFVDERFGIREGQGNVMRRLSEMPHVKHIAQIGIRGPGSSDSSDFDDARRFGSVIVGPRELRRVGVDEVVRRIPSASHYYVTIDSDGFDPALMPGTGSPSPGGLTYHEVVDLLRGIAARAPVIGFDLVEVCPAFDSTEVTQQTAARVILDFLGAIFRARDGARGGQAR